MSDIPRYADLYYIFYHRLSDKASMNVKQTRFYQFSGAFAWRALTVNGIGIIGAEFAAVQQIKDINIVSTVYNKSEYLL
jgi:hypothetical protein